MNTLAKYHIPWESGHHMQQCYYPTYGYRSSLLLFLTERMLARRLDLGRFVALEQNDLITPRGGRLG